MECCKFTRVFTQQRQDIKVDSSDWKIRITIKIFKKNFEWPTFKSWSLLLHSNFLIEVIIHVTQIIGLCFFFYLRNQCLWSNDRNEIFTEIDFRDHCAIMDHILFQLCRWSMKFFAFQKYFFNECAIFHFFLTTPLKISAGEFSESCTQLRVFQHQFFFLNNLLLLLIGLKKISLWLKKVMSRRMKMDLLGKIDSKSSYLDLIFL